MNAFLQMVGEIRQGAAASELADALADLVRTVRDTGRAGELTLKVKLKPASKGDVTTLMVEDAVTVKRPSPERGATIFFSTTENVLSRNDPRQPELAGLRAPAEVTHLRRAAAQE